MSEADRPSPPAPDNLLEFWTIVTNNDSDDYIFVTEDVARAVLDMLDKVPVCHSSGRMMPTMIRVMDLYGDENFVRADIIVRIKRSTPEGREADERHAHLLKHEPRPWE